MGYIRRALAIFLMALLALGCGHRWAPPEVAAWETPILTNVCVHLVESELEAAEQAVTNWDLALHQWRKMKFVAYGSTNCYITVYEVDASMAPRGAEQALAWVPRIGAGTIYMVKHRYERDTAGILMHELGHALGAAHVPNTLMNWQHKGKVMYICPDATTVAQVAAWHRVDLRLLAWCNV